MQKKVVFVFVMLVFSLPNAFAQYPYCTGGWNDVLCQSFMFQQQLQQGSRGDRSGGINDERIYNPDAGNYADDMVQKLQQEFLQGFDDRYANPQSLHYDPTKDRCMMDPTCDMTTKSIAHYNWLYQQCVSRNNVACQKLQAGAYTRPPSGRYPDGGRMYVPYAPGYEPSR